VSDVVDSVYLEKRMALCLEKPRDESDRGLARVYRNFAEQYERALANLVEPQTENPDGARPFMLES
jgi:hypothetical protein